MSQMDEEDRWPELVDEEDEEDDYRPPGILLSAGEFGYLHELFEKLSRQRADKLAGFGLGLGFALGVIFTAIVAAIILVVSLLLFR